MSDSYSEVSSKGWLQRLGEAIVGVLIGILLFIVSFPLLFWNEGRAVKTAQGLAEGEKSVISIGSDKVDPADEGKLVHLSGLATTDQELMDPQFGVVAKAIRLDRIVQMYQWTEKEEKKTEKKIGGKEDTTTTYTYSKQWTKDRIDSSNFKKPEGHENPADMPFPSKDETAEKVTLGAFTLSPGLVSQITQTEALPVDQAMLDKAAADTKEKMKVNGGLYYMGKDAAAPHVGDVKIEFRVTKPATVSLLAKQAGNSFTPYKTSVEGAPLIERLQTGTVSATEMFQAAQSENSMMTWILRLVGYVIMAIGIALVFKPLVVMADVLPFLGNMLNMGVGVFAGLIAIPLSLIPIALGWIFYRPLFGIILLVIAGSIVVGLVMMFRGRKKTLKPA